MSPRPRGGFEGKDGALGRHRSGVSEVTFNGLVLLGAPGRVMTPRAASEQLVAEAGARLTGRRARVYFDAEPALWRATRRSSALVIPA